MRKRACKQPSHHVERCFVSRAEEYHWAPKNECQNNILEDLTGAHVNVSTIGKDTIKEKGILVTLGNN